MCLSCAQLRFDKGDTIELISSTRTNALLEGDPYLHGQLIISPKNETWLNKLGECFGALDLSSRSHSVLQSLILSCLWPESETNHLTDVGWVQAGSRASTWSRWSMSSHAA